MSYLCGAGAAGVRTPSTATAAVAEVARLMAGAATGSAAGDPVGGGTASAGGGEESCTRGL